MLLSIMISVEDQEIVIGPPDETAPIFMIFEVPPVMAVTPSIVFPCCTFNGRNGNLSLSTKFLGHPCSQPLTDLGERWLDTRHHSFPLVPRRLGRTPGPDSESWLYQIFPVPRTMSSSSIYSSGDPAYTSRCDSTCYLICRNT
ncbi:hypothetical protein SCLCIDRAFT_778897 [Scleroderma citrinum Foug A]|uniref:Uncharacterized protein n=1 Tax=Scleroderma citrinum Foug A TaxID=1036808 RepID=A0A0C3E494_9AGAM|nr:hypothetical protein SCLCIDRAFT_778897 [Scleroderma citrinum Foug A]